MGKLARSATDEVRGKLNEVIDPMPEVKTPEVDNRKTSSPGSGSYGGYGRRQQTLLEQSDRVAARYGGKARDPNIPNQIEADWSLKPKRRGFEIKARF